MVQNTGRTTLNLTGYRITDSDKHSFTSPKNFRLKPGARVSVRSGQGRNSATTLYWGNRGYVWNNTGDRVVLKNPQGKVLEQHRSLPGGGGIANLQAEGEPHSASSEPPVRWPNHCAPCGTQAD